jgi:hypothetical protein
MYSKELINKNLVFLGLVSNDYSNFIRKIVEEERIVFKGIQYCSFAFLNILIVIFIQIFTGINDKLYF